MESDYTFGINFQLSFILEAGFTKEMSILPHQEVIFLV